MGTVPFQCVPFKTVVHILQETDNRSKKPDPAVHMSLLYHRGGGFIIKLGNWSTWKNTNSLGIPACG